MKAKKNNKKSLKQKIIDLPRFRLALFILSIIFAIFVFAVQEKPSVYADFGKVTLVNSSGIKTEFVTEIAATYLSRNQGLMKRETLGSDAGMLFIFDKNQDVGMWMKNTYISLDMFFIKEDGTIANIAKNTKTQSTDIISSLGQVRYVLETNAGVSEKYNIKAGDKAVIEVGFREDR